MGGISMLIGMGLMIAFMILFIIIGIVSIVSYILESSSLAVMRKKLGYECNGSCYIPFYNKVLYGKLADCEVQGIVLGIVSFVRIAAFGLWFLGNNAIAYWVFLISIPINAVLNMVIASELYHRYSKHHKFLMLFTILSLDLLRSIFLFSIRHNDSCVVKN